jgi:hypothetical protein
MLALGGGVPVSDSSPKISLVRALTACVHLVQAVSQSWLTLTWVRSYSYGLGCTARVNFLVGRELVLAYETISVEVRKRAIC